MSSLPPSHPKGSVVSFIFSHACCRSGGRIRPSVQLLLKERQGKTERNRAAGARAGRASWPLTMETRRKASGGLVLQIICLKYFVKPVAVQTEPVTRRTSLCPQPQAHGANLLCLPPRAAPLSASLCPPVKWAEGARAGSGRAPGHTVLPRWPRSPYGTRRCHLLLRGVEKGDGLDSCAQGNFPPVVAARLNILRDGTPAATAGTRGICQPRGHPAWQLPGILHQHPVYGPLPAGLVPMLSSHPRAEILGGWKGDGDSP